MVMSYLIGHPGFNVKSEKWPHDKQEADVDIGRFLYRSALVNYAFF